MLSNLAIKSLSLRIMKKNILYFFATVSLFISCSKDDIDSVQLNPYKSTVVSYFKEIALGFEFGNASRITRRWRGDMKIFVGGKPTSEHLVELDKIIKELNDLSTTEFEIRSVSDSLQSNFYIYFGSGDSYAKMFPEVSTLVKSNWGLFSVSFNGLNELIRGRMYVDIFRPNLNGQKHLIREELTQSLGLAKDSPLFFESIFYSLPSATTEYAQIDKDLIRLLYHPNMRTGLNEQQVDQVLKNILAEEQ